MRDDGRKQKDYDFQSFAPDRAGIVRLLTHAVQHIQQFHHRGYGSIERITPADVVIDLDDSLVDLAARGALFPGICFSVCRRAVSIIAPGEFPQPLEKPVCAFNPRVRPLQALFRRRGKHDEQAHGIRTVFIYHVLRVHAVIL